MSSRVRHSFEVISNCKYSLCFLFYMLVYWLLPVVMFVSVCCAPDCTNKSTCVVIKIFNTIGFLLMNNYNAKGNGFHRLGASIYPNITGFLDDFWPFLKSALQTFIHTPFICSCLLAFIVRKTIFVI